MRIMQGYSAIKPVMPTDGNHGASRRKLRALVLRPSRVAPPPPPCPLTPRAEACPLCPAIAAIPDSSKNFTQYKARLHSVSLTSNTGNNRYYSFNRGFTHFLVFTAESYVCT